MLAAKFESIFPHLDERQRRLLMGAEAGRWGMAGSGWWPGRPQSVRPRCRWALPSWIVVLSRWAGCGGRAGAARGPPRWTPGLRPALVEPQERGGSGAAVAVD